MSEEAEEMANRGALPGVTGAAAATNPPSPLLSPTRSNVALIAGASVGGLVAAAVVALVLKKTVFATKQKFDVDYVSMNMNQELDSV